MKTKNVYYVQSNIYIYTYVCVCVCVFIYKYTILVIYQILDEAFCISQWTIKLRKGMNPTISPPTMDKNS